MRRLFPTALPVLMLLVACTAPSPQPTPATPQRGSEASPSSSPSATATLDPGGQASSGTLNGVTGGDETPGEDDPGRFAFLCSSLDASPEVQLSSLAEVWAASNYTRMASCQVTYAGSEPFEPTPRESEAISSASTQGESSGNGLDTLLDVLRLCARISEEVGPGGFDGASRGTLLASAAYCPKGPQGKIIAAWARGERFGDGTHGVGDGVVAGAVQLLKPSGNADECAWTVTGPDGSVVARGGLAEAGKQVVLEEGQNFTSDKCGIWGKMY